MSYNFAMENFRFYYPIDVRYGDLDPQAHVNNAKYLTYIETARIKYVQHLGLWDGGSFQDIGFILADAQITYRKPIVYGQDVRVGVRFSRLGTKSLTMEYRIEDAQTGDEFAIARTIQVAYDYRTKTTIPIPENWRKIISEFEGLDPNDS